ncbi:MAG: hypothetical protein H7X77_07695 [Anaerolineae bacterium]|nr:hypothetical protein [Anaerolineae bacterium]
MNDFLLPIIIGIPFAALVGRYIARKSAAKEPIHGGSAARIAHYLGATGAAGGAIFLPFVPIMLIMGRSVQWALVMGISSMVFGLLSLVVFAAIERPALSDVQPQQERGWTEEDARKSRL